MNPTPIIDMFSGTGERARAVADGLNEFTCFQSFFDNYGPARKYLKARFRNVEIHSDFRDQDVPEGSIVAIGVPCRDLSVAGRRPFEPRRIDVVRQAGPSHLMPTPSVVDRAWGLTPSSGTTSSTATATGTARPSPQSSPVILGLRRFAFFRPGRT